MPRHVSASDLVVRRAIGTRLRRWRLDRGWSQGELAEAVGLSQPALSNYEAGRRDMPLTIASAIALELELSVVDLTGVAHPEPGASSGAAPSIKR